MSLSRGDWLRLSVGQDYRLSTARGGRGRRRMTNMRAPPQLTAANPRPTATANCEVAPFCHGHVNG